MNICPSAQRNFSEHQLQVLIEITQCQQDFSTRFYCFGPMKWFAFTPSHAHCATALKLSREIRPNLPWPQNLVYFRNLSLRVTAT